MLVRELLLPIVVHPASRRPLYPHQVAVWEQWENCATLMVAAKTGTGKTRAAMLPVVKRREHAIAVYPTNELVRDQVQSVEQLIREEGSEALVWTPPAWRQAPGRAERYGRADHILVPIDAVLLDEWQETMRCRSRGETLRRLLNPDKPKIVFTSPDVLFLILGLHYHAEPFEALRRYETLIVDEFHLYQGVELAHALAMVALARGFGMLRRLIVLSATPHPEVGKLLSRLFAPVMIGSEATPTGPSKRWRTAVHPVEVTPVQMAGGDPVEVLVSRIVAMGRDLDRLRRETPDQGYVPAVVIVNSVVNAIRLEDRLAESGFSRESLAIIRGLSNRAIRDIKDKVVAIGTSAIEVGVDFHCDYLLFEASEAASFLQRFGRVGRHRPGRVTALMPPNAFEGMSKLPAEIDRADFEDRIFAWYPEAAVRPWFVTTESGMITIRALAENLLATVAKDGRARSEVLTTLRTMIERILTDHAERLGCSTENARAKSLFDRCAAGKSAVRWLDTYRRLNRFRTSLPSFHVHDFMEQSRRQEWNLGEYEVDLATLLKRAVGLKWNDKLGMLTIKGIGKYRSVNVSPVFDKDDCGVIFETSGRPDLRIYQDGESTPISDVMCRENHVFIVVPQATVASELDWRLPVFEAGEYVVAFDGAALLLGELWKRRAGLAPGS